MLRRNLLHASSWSRTPTCVFCATRTQFQPSHARSFRPWRTAAQRPWAVRARKRARKQSEASVTARKGRGEDVGTTEHVLVRRTGRPLVRYSNRPRFEHADGKPLPKKSAQPQGEAQDAQEADHEETQAKKSAQPQAEAEAAKEVDNDKITRPRKVKRRERKAVKKALQEAPETEQEAPITLKEALLGDSLENDAKKRKKREEQLQIQILNTDELKFEAVQVDKPPVPKLAYGLDRVLFNPGVYRLQDPRSRIYNFDPYLEKIMPVNEFDFDALSEYKTSSKDQDLLDLTRRLGTKFTGSTSSMSSVLQHFHYLLSNFRPLNHRMLSRGFPDPSNRFSKITLGPSAVFLRYKDGVYAIDADKTYDSENIMSWLGHSLEKLLTTDRSEFELYRRSNPEKAPAEDNSSRCYHYSRQGNILMRSQLDAHDSRLPGTGVFDLKTRAVVSIRMNHTEYEKGSGYQLRYDQGEWESFEREFYDMTRATLLKYSLQVRMGRMDGIFIAFHNIERIFGFQYLSRGNMDLVLHGQDDTSLGDEEFKLSIGLLDDLLSRAIAKFPETSIRLHVETRDTKTRFMYIFAEPVTEEQADEIQSAAEASQKDFARRVVGIGKDNPEVQAAWQGMQDAVDEQVGVDNEGRDADEAVDEESAKEPADTQESPAAADDDTQESPAAAEHDTAATEKGPLIGWTLTARNKVNGDYVVRPGPFTKDDDWVVEYHVQEIPEGSLRRLYEALKVRRAKLLKETEKVDTDLKKYRAFIQRISDRGREWRKEQDKIDEELGVQMYRPMGPGSEEGMAQEEVKPEGVQKEEGTEAEPKRSWFGF